MICRWWIACAWLRLVLLESALMLLVALSIALPWGVFLLLRRWLFDHHDAIPWFSFLAASVTTWLLVRCLIEGWMQTAWIAQSPGCARVVMMAIATIGSVWGFTSVSFYHLWWRALQGDAEAHASLSLGNVVVSFLLAVVIYSWPFLLIGIPIGLAQNRVITQLRRARLQR